MRWLTQAGRIDDDLFLLGHADVPIYLMYVGEDRYALIEGGLCADAEMLWEQILQVTRPEHIFYWLITHKHYDHCGAMALLMPRLPNASVLASQLTYEAWQSAACRRFIANTHAALCGEHEDNSQACLKLNELPTQCVQPGEEIKLGPHCSLKAVAAPGHSQDSLAWYDSTRQRLFAGDAAGEYEHRSRQWHPLIFDDANDYLKTLASWQDLSIKQLIPGHGGCLVSHSARDIVPAILTDCVAFIERHKDVPPNQRSRLATELHREQQRLSERFVPPDLHLASMEVMLAKVTGFSISDK
ncbi:MBL fold metallo-hydrolase [Zobellella sp. DQSA1]|uniref:MBL fold metallo-hydrolase n=1 Tax=Zobellella sp. DQSA1 TaxID=3342386 RepID=UPI0035BF8D5C